MTRRYAVAGAILGSTLPWLLGNAVWIDSEFGSATGNQLFGWLWIPFVLTVATILIGRSSPRSGVISTWIVVAMLMALTVVLGATDWAHNQYILEAATAHSGTTVGFIAQYDLQVSYFSALLALALATLSLASLPFLPVSPRKLALHDDASAELIDSDPRNLWDEQSH